MKWDNVEAEEQLLGCILADSKQFADVVADFRADAFRDEELRHLAQEIDAMARKGKPPQSGRLAYTLRQKGIENAAEFLSSLVAKVSSASELQTWLEVVNNNWRRRRVVDEVEKLSAALKTMDEDTPVAEVLGGAQTALVNSFIETSRKEIFTLKECLEDAYEEHLRIANGECVPVEPTGIEALTSAIRGLRKKDVVIVAGRPSMMKSVLGKTFCETYAKRGKRSLLFSLEQSLRQMTHRIIASYAEINTRSFDSKMEQEDQKKFNDSLTDLMQWKIDLAEVRGTTVSQIEALSRMHKAKNPDLDLIVVDYLQLMRLELGRADKRVNAIGDVVNRLRDLAGELDVTVVVISQLNRGLEHRDDKRPMMSDLRESGEIEEAADVVLLMYWPSKYWPQMVDDGVGELGEIIIGKSRQTGGVGDRVIVRFNGPHAKLEDCSLDDKRQYMDWLGKNKKLR